MSKVQIWTFLLIFFTTIFLAECNPKRNYESVQFIPKINNIDRSHASSADTGKSRSRFSRHVRVGPFANQLAFQFPINSGYGVVWWPENTGYDFHQNEINYGNDGHGLLDFTNGLDYHDPFLLTGSKAKSAARFLYGKGLFFSDIPHTRAVLFVQEKRQKNGLPPNRLGSIRIHSPWYRYPDELQEIFSHPDPYEFFI